LSSRNLSGVLKRPGGLYFIEKVGRFRAVKGIVIIKSLRNEAFYSVVSKKG